MKNASTDSAIRRSILGTVIVIAGLALGACSGSGNIRPSHNGFGGTTASTGGGDTGSGGGTTTGGSGSDSGGGSGTGSSNDGGSGTGGGSGDGPGGGPTASATAIGAITSGLGDILVATGGTVSGAGMQLPNQLLLGGDNALTQSLATTVDDSGNLIADLGNGISDGLGQSGNIDDPVGTTVQSLGSVVEDTGDVVQDLGTTVNSVDAFEGTPIESITSPLSQALDSAGSELKDGDALLGNVLGSDDAQSLTVPLDHIVTSAAGLGQSTAGGDNLIASASLAVGGVTSGAGEAVSYLGTAVGDVSLPGDSTAISSLGTTVNDLGGSVTTLGNGIQSGLGTAGGSGDVVASTLNGATGAVSGLGATVDDASTTISGLNGSMQTPLSPVTDVAGGLVQQVGDAVTSTGNALGAATDSPSGQTLTQDLSSVVNNLADATSGNPGTDHSDHLLGGLTATVGTTLHAGADVQTGSDSGNQDDSQKNGLVGGLLGTLGH